MFANGLQNRHFVTDEVTAFEPKGPSAWAYCVGRPGLEPGTYGLKVRRSTS